MKTSTIIVLAVCALSAVHVVSATNYPITWTTGHKYPPLQIAVGDSITFTWQGGHNVATIPTPTCPLMGIGSGIKILAPTSFGGVYTWNATAPGKYIFACTVGDHCLSGQKIEVTVA